MTGDRLMVETRNTMEEGGQAVVSIFSTELMGTFLRSENFPQLINISRTEHLQEGMK